MRTNFTYQYDNNGNMIQKTAKVGGAITQFEYDAENKLVRVMINGTTTNYRYDGLGRRVEKEVIAGTTTVTKYVYDNEDILLELNGSNAIVARYTHGPGIDEPLIMEKNSQSFYYHADGLGSITELTNQSGTVVERYTYSSFGKIESQLDANFVQPYTYTSREFDPETGLYFYRARYYESTIGRFLQEDPVRFVSGTNFYSGLENNPTTWIDPFGLYRWYPVPGYRRWEVQRHSPHHSKDYPHEHYRYRGQEVPRKVDPKTGKQIPHGETTCPGPDQDVPQEVIDAAKKASPITGIPWIDDPIVNTIDDFLDSLRDLGDTLSRVKPPVVIPPLPGMPGIPIIIPRPSR